MEPPSQTTLRTYKTTISQYCTTLNVTFACVLIFLANKHTIYLILNGNVGISVDRNVGRSVKWKCLAGMLNGNVGRGVTLKCWGCRTGRLEAGAWSGLAVGSEAHTFVLFLVNT